MRGNIGSFEKPFSHAEVVALAERTLKRFGGDRNKAGRYARSMENRYESSKWAQVVEVIVTGGRQHHATKKMTKAERLSVIKAARQASHDGDHQLAAVLFGMVGIAHADGPPTEGRRQGARWESSLAHWKRYYDVLWKTRAQ